jgi:hypothetical protein
MQTLTTPILDGTYSVQDTTLTDYAAKWDYGYIVAIRQLSLTPSIDVHPVELAMAAMQAGVSLVGVWTYPVTGTVFLDEVEHIDSLSDALRIAAERNELAIWSLADNACIYLPVS